MQKQKAAILFAELPGFQALAGHLPPKELTLLMKELYALMENTIRLNRGTINRYTGDTFLAVFSPKSVNAVDAALELKDRLGSFNDKKKLPSDFTIKTGVATGTVLTGDIGTKTQKQETIMGEAVNQAIRICHFAGDGQILVDKPTYEAAKNSYEFQAIEPIPVKGGMESIAIYEPLKKKRKKLELVPAAERKIVSEMVGRNEELEQVENLISELIKGNGSVVSIVGKAGIGKSRLMEEMKVQPIMEKVVLLEGRAQSTGQNLSFHPIIHLIRSWAGISEEEAPEIASGKLLTGIKKIAPDQTVDIYSFLATMMGLPLTGKYSERVKDIEGEALEKLILKNLRDLIVLATKDKPRIYMIEDLHWADSSSISFFESLYKLSQNHPVMFINVLRPGYQETGDYILNYLDATLPDNHTVINVAPLKEKESGELICNLMKKVRLPEKVRQMIISKTEGNPFFIEEVIRSFLDEGIIEIKDKEFNITEKINEVNIPETINDVILSRVDKLDEKTKDLLKTASVIGRNFYYKVLEEAADTIGELDSRIEYLKDVQLIGESKKKEEIEFLFKHALAQQATYESIILNTKKELHLKIARSIEKVFSDNLHEHYGSLAYHFEKAENREKTVEYLIKAGDEAMKSAASAEAINYFNKALDLYTKSKEYNPDPQTIINLEEKLAYALFAKGRNVESVKYFDKVYTYYASSVPRKKIHIYLTFIKDIFLLIIGVLFSKENKKRDATPIENKLIKIMQIKSLALLTFDTKRLFFETLHIAQYINKIKLSSTSYGNSIIMSISALFFWTGRSVSFANKLMGFSSANQDDKNTRGWISYNQSEAVRTYLVSNLEEEDISDEIYDAGTKIGEFWYASVYMVFRALIQTELGKRVNAQRLIDKLKLILDSFENSLSISQYYRVQLAVYKKFREMETGMEFSKKAVKYVSTTDHSGMLLLIYCSASIIYSLQGELDAARDYLNKANEQLLSISIKLYQSMCLLAEGVLLLEEIKANQPDNNNSDILYRKLSKTTKALIKQSQNVYGNLTEAYRMRAIYHQLTGNPRRAKKYYKKSIDWANYYGTRLELSRTYFELGKFLSDPKTKHNQLNDLSGKDYLEKAKSMFEEMDLQRDLEEYRKFMDRSIA
jgi:class 3 adenylate cyclase/tetratricopeptide (TPR) repeat protein